MNRNRISILSLFLLLGVVLASPFGGASCFADDDVPDDNELARYIEYERKLNAILKTRRDEEKQFVGEVVNQVRLGKIPSKLVATSFDWVRKKRPDTEHPFVYFEKVLRIQATALGLGDEIPPFDFDIYSTPAQHYAYQTGPPDEGTFARIKAFFSFGSNR